MDYWNEDFDIGLISILSFSLFYFEYYKINIDTSELKKEILDILKNNQDYNEYFKEIKQVKKLDSSNVQNLTKNYVTKLRYCLFLFAK